MDQSADLGPLPLPAPAAYPSSMAEIQVGGTPLQPAIATAHKRLLWRPAKGYEGKMAWVQVAGPAYCN